MQTPQRWSFCASVAAVATLLVLLGSGGIQAGIVVDPAEFSPDRTRIDFESLAAGTSLTTQYAADGVTFALEGTSASAVIYGDTASRFYTNAGANAVANFPGGTFAPFPNMLVTFDAPVNRVAFEIRTNDPDDLHLELICIANGQVVATDDLSTFSTYRFLGVESEVSFDQVLIDVTGTSNGAFLLDTLMFEEDLSDGDGDGVIDIGDNCVDHPNPSQDDTDGDGIGDACAPDGLLLHNGLSYDDPTVSWLFASYLVETGLSGTAFHAHLADDVLFPSGGWRNVTGMRWMGVEVDTENPDQFTRTVDIAREFDVWFMADDGSGTAPTPPPTQLVDFGSPAYAHRRVTVRAKTAPSPFGNLVGLYTATWNTPVVLRDGVRYWVSVTAVNGFNDTDAFSGGDTGRVWAWMIGDGADTAATGSPAVEGGDMLGSTSWAPTGGAAAPGGFVPQFDLFGYVNTPPSCDAGGPYEVTCDQTPIVVPLDGSLSFDPDGDALAYSWSSSCGGLSGGSTATPLLEIGDACATPTCSVSLTIGDGLLTRSCNPGAVIVHPKATLDDVTFDQATTQVQVPVDDVTSFSVGLTNAGSCPASATGVDVVSDFATPAVSATSIVPSLGGGGRVCPGPASVNLSVDSHGAIGGSYPALVRLLGLGDEVVSSALDVFVNDGLKPDLDATRGGGLTVSGDNGAPPLGTAEGFTLTLHVSNVGAAPAAPFVVNFWANDALLGSQSVASALAIGGTATVSLNLPGGTLAEGSHVLEAEVVTGPDEDLSADNNTASAFLQVGTPAIAGEIVVDVSGNPGCAGDTLRFDARARYLIDTATFPVKGAPITVSLLPDGPIAAGHTTVDGTLSGTMTLPAPGSYILRAEVSDLSLSGTGETVITVASGSTCPTAIVVPPPDPVVDPVYHADLGVCSYDIEFLADGCATPLGAAPAAGDTICVRATAHYHGNFDGVQADVRLRASRLDPTPLEDSLGDGQMTVDLSGYPTGTVLDAAQAFEFDWVIPDVGDWIVELSVDPNVNQPLNNDVATRALTVGAAAPSAGLDVTAGLGGCSDYLSVSGRVRYVGAAGLQPESPIAGCIEVSAVLFDTDGTTELATAAGRTDGLGRYRLSLDGVSILSEQDYPVVVTAVDGSLTGTTTTIHRCGPGPSPGGGGGGGGGQADDLFVYAEDMVFLGDDTCSSGLTGVPDVDRTIGIHATLRQAGTTAHPGESVVVTEFRPVAGTMQPFAIDTATVDFDGTGPRPLCVGWTPDSQGTRIVQVEIDASYPQDESNDAATRAITIGTPPCELALDAASVILNRGESASLGLAASDTLDVRAILDLAIQPVPPAALPSGLTVTFSPGARLVSPFSATVDIATTFATPPGSYPVIVTGFGDACQPVTTVNVLALNRGPSVVSPGDQSMTAGETLSVTVTASDPEGDALTLAASGLPAFATFADNGDGTATITFAPGLTDFGDFAGWTITATDAHGASADTTFALEVLPAGPPPCGSLDVQVDLHTVQTGSHPGSTKTPLEGLEVRVFDKSDGSCAAGLGISWQHYPEIWSACQPDGVGVTDANGSGLVPLPAGEYLVIGEYDPDGLPPDGSGNELYVGNSVGGFSCAPDDDPSVVTKRKYLQVIATADGRKMPGKYARLTGSELLIIEPEYVVWDGTEQAYPFVFQSVGDWSVAASVDPPEGFVSDYDSLSEDVASEVEAVQFTITEVGSDLVPTKSTFVVNHKGRRTVVRSSVGILLTPAYAVSRGFDPLELSRRGLIKDRPHLPERGGSGAKTD